MTTDETRTAALSEAAAICDREAAIYEREKDILRCGACHDCARLIRALIANPPGSSEPSPEVAALDIDWQQVVLNGGPPCFHVEDGSFCLRAERWPGHEAGRAHSYVPLARLLCSANPSTAPEPVPEVIHIVFDGPPGPEAGRFVEVETPDGRSIRAGEWRQVGDYWHLIIRQGREVAP